MSHTDKTDPWFVQERDNNLTFNHQSLPGRWIRWPKTWKGVKCPCPMCRDKMRARSKTKKTRAEGKRQARDGY